MLPPGRRNCIEVLELKAKAPCCHQGGEGGGGGDAERPLGRPLAARSEGMPSGARAQAAHTEETQQLQDRNAALAEECDRYKLVVAKLSKQAPPPPDPPTQRPVISGGPVPL